MTIFDVKTCPICGKKFTAHNAMQKYCGDACAGTAGRLYRTAYQKQYRQNKKGGLNPEAYSLTPQVEEPCFTGLQWLSEWKAAINDPENVKVENKRRRDFMKKNPVGTILDEETIRDRLNDRSFKFIPEDLDDKTVLRLQKKYNGGAAYRDPEGQYYRLVRYKTDTPTDAKAPFKLVPVSANEVYPADLQKPKRPAIVVDYSDFI